MTPRRRFVEAADLTLLDADRTPGTLAETCAKAIAVHLAYQSSLPINYLQSALGTCRHARTATVALVFVDDDDIPQHFAHAHLPVSCRPGRPPFAGVRQSGLRPDR